MSLYQEVLSYPNLIKGFYRVQENDGMPGTDGISISAFEDELEKNAMRLKSELISFTYKPKPLLMFERLKADGGKRVLFIPAVRDRVVQSSAFIVLNPVIDKELEKETYAYRSGLSRETAARQINKLYDEGYIWILDADIRKYFDNINHDLLLERMSSVISEKEITDLLFKWIKGEYYTQNRRLTITKGIPQGSVISPMLANLYLDKFDEQIKKEGFRLVRYADDFIILTKTKSEAEKALLLTKELLTALKLELNEQKTAITNFDTGFKYLGYIFLRSLVVPASKSDTSLPIKNQIYQNTPEVLIKEKKKRVAKETEKPVDEKTLSSSEVGNALLEALGKKGITLNNFLENIKQEETKVMPLLPAQEVEKILLSEEEVDEIEAGEPGEEKETIPPETKIPFTILKHTLYVQEQGSILKKEGNRLIILKDEKEILDLPAIKIRDIIIFGTCSLTPAAMQYCLRAGIPIVLLSSMGKYYGRINTTDINNGEYTKLQVLRSIDENFRITFARNVIDAKFNNCKVLLQRNLKRKKTIPPQSMDQIKYLTARLSAAKTTDEVRGYEGSGAVAYFNAFGYLFDKTTGFYTEKFLRTKRPPKDPVNSLLSFGYTLLSSTITSLIYARNLNPFIGFMHSVKTGHPALASDLIEEFRNLIDSLVVQVINKKIITRNDFYYQKEPALPCLLTNAGRKAFINQYEIKMHQRITHHETGDKVDYIRCIDLQVQQILQVIKGDKPEYKPFKLRF